jgi:hypothetical protein
LGRNPCNRTFAGLKSVVGVVAAPWRRAIGERSVKEERGANAGPYRVEIRWAKKTGKKYRDPDSGEILDKRAEGLPPRYHLKSELTAEVSAERTKFDFDLKSN